MPSNKLTPTNSKQCTLPSCAIHSSFTMHGVDKLTVRIRTVVTSHLLLTVCTHGILTLTVKLTLTDTVTVIV